MPHARSASTGDIPTSRNTYRCALILRLWTVLREVRKRESRDIGYSVTCKHVVSVETMSLVGYKTSYDDVLCPTSIGVPAGIWESKWRSRNHPS